MSMLVTNLLVLSLVYLLLLISLWSCNTSGLAIHLLSRATHNRQLSQSPRIRLHKHLFTSLLIYAILSSLLKINLLVNQEEEILLLLHP